MCVTDLFQFCATAVHTILDTVAFRVGTVLLLCCWFMLLLLRDSRHVKILLLTPLRLRIRFFRKRVPRFLLHKHIAFQSETSYVSTP